MGGEEHEGRAAPPRRTGRGEGSCWRREGRCAPDRIWGGGEGASDARETKNRPAAAIPRHGAGSPAGPPAAAKQRRWWRAGLPPAVEVSPVSPDAGDAGISYVF